jgi:3-phenylpropionate/trans-cinnamate dioxygenase ferredoxin reductase subunit
MSEGILVVGASQAGVQLAASLRDLGSTAPITLVGAEPHLPYQRPPLSKAYLTGSASADSLALRTREYYREQGIDLVLGERVVDIDLEQGRATTDRHRELRAEQVALTTGARPRPLVVPGSDLTGVLYLRDLDDAGMVAAALRTASSVVIVGGGYIGLEAASASVAAGRRTTVLEAAGRLIERVAAPVLSEFFLRLHRGRGVDVRLGQVVTRIEGRDGAVTAVCLDTGELLAADLVLVGIGVTPRTELAHILGLDVQGGIVVDRQGRTSDSRVVAAGDCTLLPHPLEPDVMVRLESVQNAVEQAKIAAGALLGRGEVYDTVPWFWSDQGDVKLQIAGISAGFDEVVVRGDPTSRKFSVLYYRRSRLIAADSVNAPGDYLAVRRALTARASLDPAFAADPGVPLKSLLPA